MRAAVGALGIFLATAATAQDRPRMVDPADLGIGTKKYLGKPVEVRGLRCHYADVSDYRCVSLSNVVVFTSTIANSDGRRWVEENCDSVNVSLTSSKCRLNVRFTPQADEINQDFVSGLERRTIYRPQDVEIVLPKKR